MGKGLDSTMHAQMNHYKKVIDQQVIILAKAKEDVEAVLVDLEQETMNLMKDRKLSAAERVNRMAPFIEEQDQFNSFLENIESLLGWHLRKQND